MCSMRVQIEISILRQCVASITASPKSRNGRYGIFKSVVSVRFDALELHHLAPLFGLYGDKLAEVGGRAWKCSGAPLGKPRLHLGIGKGRVDLRVELVNDLGWR